MRRLVSRLPVIRRLRLRGGYLRHLAFVATLSLVLSPAAVAQARAKFTLHVTGVWRDSFGGLHVKAESKTVRYKLSCSESIAKTCYMPQAGREYQARLAPNPQFLYMYGITKSPAIFEIDSESEKARRSLH